jgi:CO/xanthine dehydrogenase Mo-binding subunit
VTVESAAEVIGRPRVTRESARHVRGRGRFVADLQLPGMLHVALVHSPHAHAAIRGIDVEAARGAPGVHAVLTGADVARRSTPVFSLAALHDPPLPIPIFALAHERARYVGEPVAAVAAISRALAEDAAELVRVDYEPLPALTSTDAARAEGAPRIHDGIPGNVIMHRAHDFGDVDGAFARAAHVVRRRLRWSRQTGAALDTFGCVAHHDPGSGEITFWSNHQSYTLLWTLAAPLGIPSHRIKGIPMDVGGAFGGKFWQPRPMVVCALLSTDTGRPVRFLEDRPENLEAGDNHGEERTYDAELALDGEGRMLALRYRVVEDYGAYFMLGPVNNSEPLAQAVGPYAMDAVGIDFTGVLTNKTNQAAYRGFGTAALNFLLERMTDAGAEATGLSRVEIRERNLLQPEQFPYTTPIGNVYDSGDYPKALRRALEAADWDGWRARQEAARAEGRAIGLGLATCQERAVPSITAHWVLFDQKAGRATTAAETASCRVDNAGQVRVALHSPGLGTSTETVATMVVAQELGVDPEQVSVTRLDTTMAGPAMGPAGSRMTVMLGGAVEGAVTRVREQMRAVAAHMLEADPDDLEWNHAEPGFQVRGVPGSAIGMKAIAHRANSQSLLLPDGVPSGLEATFTYDHPLASMPSDRHWGAFAPIMGHAVHVPVVEVDTETGEVSFLAYTVVHDCGTVVNPPAVRGQVLGGICQGIGGTLGEELAYREDGTLVQRDFRDYLVPTFLEMPEVRFEHLETPSPYTYRGVKGVGEGGRMVAPPAVVSAIEDALRPWGARIDEIPVTPDKILAWIGSAKGPGEERQ